MTEIDTTDALRRFSRRHIPWVVSVRKIPFIVSSLAVLVLYCVFLPTSESVSLAAFYLNLSCFSILFLAWCINILVWRDISERYKMIVAFFMLFTFCNLFYRFAGADWTKLVHFFFNFPLMKGCWHVLFRGLGTTIFLAAVSFVSCIALGLTVAILRSLNIHALNIFIKIYVDIFRSIPVIVLMVVLFFACPFLGIYLDSYLTTFTALTLSYGAYTAETFRAGMESVPSGQLEAARALGLSRWKTLVKVIIPQSIPLVIPVLTGNMIAMVKDTAIASIVAAPELLKSARELYTAKTSPTPLVCAAIIFLAVLLPLVRIVNQMEKRINKSATHY